MADIIDLKIDSGDMPCRHGHCNKSKCDSVDNCFCEIFDISYETKEYMPLFNLAKEMDKL